MEKETKFELEKKQKETKIKVNTQAIEKAEKEMKFLVKELDSKKYLLTKDKKIAKSILDFIENEAKWKSTECFGVIEISKQIKKFLNGEDKNLMVDATAAQAIRYFLSSKEGVGVENAKKFSIMIKPVNDTIELMKADKQKFDELNLRIESLKNGLDPDKAEDEFKKENEK